MLPRKMEPEETGRWLRHKFLGAGAFGIVELWRNENTGNTIAIKKCQGDALQLKDKQRQRWLSEVKTMNSLRHRNIVGTRKVPAELKDIGGGLPVLCMEFCNQGDLRMVLNQSENCCGIVESEALTIMHDISSAVEYLHSQTLTHRDLKPENIVLQRQKEKTIYKLTDFGYVRELGEESIDASVVGTRNYLAPELLWKPCYTCSVDYWSLGILFYEIVTGNRPFLPNLPITETWIESIKKKKFEDIRAWGDEKSVSFGTEIEKPSTLSPCMRPKLEKWFRVALQFDPKKRGKLPEDYSTSDKQSRDNLIIFKLLSDILTLKIIYVFVVPQYRRDSYAVHPNIRIDEMQALIQEKTRIEAARQILTDLSGQLINRPDALIFEQIEGSPQLVLFNRDKLHIEIIPKSATFPPIDRMLASPRDNLDSETISRCYAAFSYFTKQELELFKSYIISLSIKIDLSNASLEWLRENVEKLTASANFLMNDLKERAQSALELREALETTISKTHTLLEGAGQVGAKLDALSSQFEQLKAFFEPNRLEKWTQLHEKVTSIYESSLKRKPGKPESAFAMVKLVYEALKIHNEQLRSKEIEAFVSGVTRFDTNIQQLEESLNSFQALVDVYRQNFSEILTSHAVQMASLSQMPRESMTETDSIILDNIIMSKLVDELLQDFPNPEQVFDLTELEF